MASFSAGSLWSTVLDEIALDGLEGITLKSLWVYLEKSLKISYPLPRIMQVEVWKFLLRMKDHLAFYELPSERATVKIYDRFDCVDEDLGVPLTPSECPVVRYKVVPISQGTVKGSCESYKVRKLLSFDEVDLSLEDVEKRWGNKFVIVASQELRYKALTPPNAIRPKDMTSIQYCIWEAIGRARYYGETTSGTWSLTHFCKDSTIVFYVKNKLIQLGLISHQLFNEKRGERLCSTTLLTLPRFFHTRRSSLLNMVEKMFLILKEKPEHTMPLTEVRACFPTLERQRSMKKAMLTHLFRQIFETRSIPYYDVFKASKNKNASSTRTVIMLCLRHPEKDIDDVFDSLENETDKIDDDAGEEFHSEKHSYVDMPLREQFYNCVSRFGSRGCSQTEIYKYMSINHLTLRQMVKQMMADGLLGSYIQDVGRQRVNMYVAIENSDTIKKQYKNTIDVLQNLQCEVEPNIPHEDVEYADVPTITARVKTFKFRSNLSMQRENHSQRLVSRKTFTVQKINERCILPFQLLRKLMQSNEKEQGFKDEICQKSVQRMLHYMSEQKIVNAYEIVLHCEENIRIYRYVTHPKIDIDHLILKREILKLKTHFFLSLEEKRVRQNLSVINHSRLNDSQKQQKPDQRVGGVELLTLKKHRAPKFLISRYLHEFLFYIVVELNERQTPFEITYELLQEWQKAEPSLRTGEYMEELSMESVNIKAYTKDISWRTFIQPLRSYADKPAGWVYFLDAVDRMPLSIFNKIFHLDKGVDERLSAYLNHPIKQHYLMRHLPTDLQYTITRIQLQRVYISVLKLLNHMGLIQVSNRVCNKDPLMMWVYLNGKARILDTTNAEAAYKCLQTDRDYTPIKFELKSFDDIHNYWTTLQRICVYTKLGFRSRNRGKPEPIKELNFLNSTEFDDAPHHDIGYQPGDGLGAAGLSTHLFAHTFRNWSWSVQSSKLINLKNRRTGRTINSGVTRSTSKVVRVIGRKRQARSTIKRAQAQSSTVSKRKRKTAPRDAVDRDALKNMRTLRASWSKSEDEILLMAKAVSVYIGAPIASLALLSMNKVCRDVIRHSLGIYNKTISACLRRLQFLIRQKRHIPQVPSWVHVLQTNEQVHNKYGDMFLHRLKLVYPNRTEFCDALLVHYALILCALFRNVYNSQNQSAKSRFILPDTIEEFEKRFSERLRVQTEDEIVYKNPETNADVQTMVVINVLHSSLCALRDKTLYNLQAFEIYKHFSEEILHEAFTKARSDGLAVTLKRQNIDLLSNQLSGPAYVLSSKYRLKLLYLRLPYGVYDAVYEYLERGLQIFFGSNKAANQSTKSKLELKSPTLGQLFMIGEGLAQGMWDINLKLPVNILTVDADQSQTVSSMDRILDHYHSIFDNAPQQEYSKILDSEPSDKQLGQVRIKFHPGNLSYKIHHSPYDMISKLPSRYLHFFCALDYIDQEVEIDFSKLQCKAEDGHFEIACPFSCVLKSTDYLSEIRRIVVEKRVILVDLSDIPPQQLLNQATSGLSIKLQASNLLTLIRILETFWDEKASPYERKDLGKIASNLTRTKLIDWNELCNDILKFEGSTEEEFDKLDEYEPTLNKEERIVRAQDVFVVNLPTLQLSLSGSLQSDTDVVEHQGIRVPKKLMSPETQRESILKKVLNESYWKYTDNDLRSMAREVKAFGFSDIEEKHLEEIHDFIESHKLGVSFTELTREFPYERFLLKTINFLSANCLIKRVGVATIMYVHKNHVRSWLVQTFNLKRLDRENIGSTTAALKRTYDELASKAEEPTSTKRARTNAESLSDSVEGTFNKRISKPPKRFESMQTKSASIHPKERDIIVMKPVPWIRLNGSINRRVLDRWLGSVLSECITRNGCSVQTICTRFPHMFPVDIMFLLEILCDLSCIKITEIRKRPVDIFSTYENIQEVEVPFVCDPHNTFVCSHGDATTRLCLFIGRKMYNSEFV